MQTHYYSLNDYLRKQFSQKVYKLSLNAGLTCPNRDGTLGIGGCIFCSEGGSGDFCEDRNLCITDQIEMAKIRVKNKIKNGKYIAYFQAFSNTYGPIEYLEKIFFEAINNDDIVAISIATRSDCLPSNVIDLLDRLNKIKPVWVELGLQTIHEESALFIRRGYNLECFEDAVKRLKSIQVQIIVHLILGLPNETKDDMIKSVSYISKIGVNGVKFSVLHILDGTDLADMYKASKIKIIEFSDYIDILMDCITHLDKNIVIHRLTGDGPKSILLAPLWTGNKKFVLNTINRELKSRNIKQGIGNV